MQHLKIGLVLSHVPSYSETFFTSKINGLAERRFQIILFARGRKPAGLKCRVVNPYPVPHYTLWRILYMMVVVPLTLVRALRPCIRLWKMERADGSGWMEALRSLYINAHILPHHLHWLHFGFATQGIGRENVAGAIGARMAVSLRGYDIHVYPLKHPGCYGRLWDKVTKVHSISRHLLERAWESGLPEAIPNQIITPAVRTPLPAKENFEFQMPLNLLTVARLTWIKGLNYALQAVALLKAQGLDIHYTIIGEGPEREHLLHEIHELRLTNQVTLAGKLSHSEALTSMRNADIYLQPSLNEGFCNAVLEAQAMGCLCVVSDVGALPENILHNYTGWLVTPKKPEEVVNKINYVFNLPVKEREFISYNARKRVTEKFAMEQHVSHWSLFYQ